MSGIELGIKGTRMITVTEDVTARHLGSGGVKVFATPAMILLMEGAAVNAIDALLPEGQASVGIEVSVKHLAATPIGFQVRAEAEVISVEGRKVLFKVTAWDDQELIGEGTHTRFVIDKARYFARIEEKQQKRP
ncbi:MAG: thioesterase family protein [Anaerolineae bacterium]|nr:thioesterase family protein [Anaerolineae bacterium]CAG0978449.1 acyl-CoA thioesterase [Anaerolineae bacterium]